MIFPNPFRFVAAMVISVWAKLGGYRVLATEPEERARWLVCRDCPYLIKATSEDSFSNDQCRVCTCFIDYKIMLAVEQCPKKKWLRIWQKKRTV